MIDIHPKFIYALLVTLQYMFLQVFVLRDAAVITSDMFLGACLVKLVSANSTHIFRYVYMYIDFVFVVIVYVILARR